MLHKADLIPVESKDSKRFSICKLHLQKKITMSNAADNRLSFLPGMFAEQTN